MLQADAKPALRVGLINAWPSTSPALAVAIPVLLKNLNSGRQRRAVRRCVGAGPHGEKSAAERCSRRGQGHAARRRTPRSRRASCWPASSATRAEDAALAALQETLPRKG